MKICDTCKAIVSFQIPDRDIGIIMLWVQQWRWWSICCISPAPQADRKSLLNLNCAVHIGHNGLATSATNLLDEGGSHESTTSNSNRVLIYNMRSNLMPQIFLFQTHPAKHDLKTALTVIATGLNDDYEEVYFFNSYHHIKVNSI